MSKRSLRNKIKQLIADYKLMRGNIDWFTVLDRFSPSVPQCKREINDVQGSVSSIELIKTWMCLITLITGTRRSWRSRRRGQLQGRAAPVWTRVQLLLNGILY